MVSLQQALTELQDQMQESFLLAHPEVAQDRMSHVRKPVQGCTYNAAIELLRDFVLDYQHALPIQDEYKNDDFSRVTMHSLRAWLATFCRQLNVPDSQANELLHWSNGKMIRLYNRNFEATEVHLRTRIQYAMTTGWKSAGKQHRLREPPRWEECTVRY